MLGLRARDRAEALGLDFGRVRPVLDAASAAVAGRTFGYALLIAEKTA